MASQKLRIEPTIGPVAAGELVRAPRRHTVEVESRPAIVTLFSALYLASGSLCAALLISGYGEREFLAFAFAWPYPTLLLCGIAVAAGGLLLMGMPLGWYLAVFVLVDSSVLALWEAERVFQDTSGAIGGVVATASHYAESVLRFTLSLGLLCYFFSADLRRFLKVGASHAWLGLLLLIALEAALIINIGLGST